VNVCARKYYSERLVCQKERRKKVWLKWVANASAVTVLEANSCFYSHDHRIIYQILPSHTKYRENILIARKLK
jgi:hypothetical protein